MMPAPQTPSRVANFATESARIEVMSERDPEREFELLVSRYGQVIRAAVRSVVGHDSRGLGDDVEQQVLLELWKQISREQTIRFPSSYLYKAAIRETIRLVRQARRRAGSDPEELPLADPDPNRQPERRADSVDVRRQLEQATGSLQPERRIAVVAHLAGYRVQEIMEANGWSYQKARNLVARGMADLRRYLGKNDDG